jgi:L-amino acid N-acyltransferase
MKSAMVRPACDSDSTRIFEIRNDVIRTSDAIFEDEPWSREKWDAWWNTREKSLPFLVVADENDIAQGYAVIAYFADRTGYRVTGEVSIHLDPIARGKGYGRTLFTALIEAGRAFGFISLVSRISAANPVSVGLHERVGFTRAGHLHKVARKFGTLIDVYFYQKNFTST